MIGIEPNILRRLWLDDDPAQNKRIDALLAAHGSTPGSLRVTDVVLAQTVWTLRSAFDQDKAGPLIAVRSLLHETAFAFHGHLRPWHAQAAGGQDPLTPAGLLSLIGTRLHPPHAGLHAGRPHA